MINQSTYVWSESSNDIFERFAVQLEKSLSLGQTPKSGDRDIQYYIELQRYRLQSKGLSLKYTFTPRGHFAEKAAFQKKWTDVKYLNQMEARTCVLERVFLKDNKQIYHRQEPEVFYQTVTYLRNGNEVGEDLYSCPSCAAICRIKELQEGCSYCGTQFVMTDLFPKVTNFFMLKDDSGTNSEIKNEIRRFIIPCSIISIIGFFIFYNLQGSDLISSILSSLFGGFIMGCVSGYIFWAFFKLASLFGQAGKSVGFLINSAGSEKKFVNTMKMYCPDFSYEYFTNKVVSLLKIMMYLDDVQESPNYAGQPLDGLFDNIVDASMYGVALKECKIENNTAYVMVDTYIDSYYYEYDRTKKQRDVFRINLFRRLDLGFNLSYSIHSIHCKGCSGSYDATKQKSCPFCGAKTSIADDDWIVTQIKKIK